MNFLLLLVFGVVNAHFPWEANLHYRYPAEKYFQQPLDHFNPTVTETFKQRYYISTEYWDKNGGPIFFYTGNEGDVTLFLNNTGFLWDIAPKFRAMVVFAEHRYYGKSQPYPGILPNSKNIEKFGQFTVEQALTDFAKLIDYLKATIKGANHSPVIAFGGSYGGMLAAWLRLKYPFVVDGAIAGSAPVAYFPGLTKCNSYYNVVTEDFFEVDGGKACTDNIRRSWLTIEKTVKLPGGYKKLTEMFHLCKPLNNTKDLNSWLENAWTSLAMANYPYPANFLNPLPRWPIQETCKHLSIPNLQGENLLDAIYNAASVFFNSTGESTCYDVRAEASPGLSAKEWEYQTCAEMPMPFCATGVEDMFKPDNWTEETFAKNCMESYGISPRFGWPVLQFGGRDWKYSSNIVFSNGKLDPWKVGGVFKSESQTITTILIDKAAHHLDLRHANKLDPMSVIKARQIEISEIHRWITDAGYEF